MSLNETLSVQGCGSQFDAVRKYQVYYGDKRIITASPSIRRHSCSGRLLIVMNLISEGTVGIFSRAEPLKNSTS